MPRFSVARFFLHHGFLLGLLAAVLLAFLVPEWGAKEGPLRAGFVAKAGVFLIFLLQGLSLRTKEMLQGMGNLRLHLLVQGWIFIVAGALLAGTGWFLRQTSLAPLADGFLYLALLPTTISSAVAFTTAAGGNVPAAIVNTTFANVLGVFWVPAGCLLFFAAGAAFPTAMLGPLLLKLANLILIPLLCGQLLRPLVSKTALFQSLRPGFRFLQSAVIVFIVFSSFSRSILADTWNDVSPVLLLPMVIVLGIMLLLIHGGLWFVAGRILPRPNDRIAVLFCGSQRTLAAGAPMAVAIFHDGQGLPGVDPGLLLLPLLCYHPMQLFLAALLLPRLRTA
jgi:sodium/bile acid cotransporter 7